MLVDRIPCFFHNLCINQALTKVFIVVIFVYFIVIMKCCSEYSLHIVINRFTDKEKGKKNNEIDEQPFKNFY